MKSKNEPEKESVSVDIITLPNSFHVSVYFNFDIEGEMSMNKTADQVDSKVMEARNMIHKKLANKFGVDINFMN